MLVLLKCLDRFWHKLSLNAVIIITKCLDSESKYQLKSLCATSGAGGAAPVLESLSPRQLQLNRGSRTTCRGLPCSPHKWKCIGTSMKGGRKLPGTEKSEITNDN